MLTATHQKGPKTVRNQIKLHAFGRMHTPVQSIKNTIVNNLNSLKNLTPTESDCQQVHRSDFLWSYIRVPMRGKPVTSIQYPIPITHHPLPITQYPSPNTQYPSPITHHPSPNSVLEIGDFIVL